MRLPGGRSVLAGVLVIVGVAGCALPDRRASTALRLVDEHIDWLELRKRHLESLPSDPSPISEVLRRQAIEDAARDVRRFQAFRAALEAPG